MKSVYPIIFLFYPKKHIPRSNLGPSRPYYLFDFPKVTDVWISPPPSNFAFVTFDAAEGVEKVLANTPVAIFGQRYVLFIVKPFTRPVQLTQVARGSKETETTEREQQQGRGVPLLSIFKALHMHNFHFNVSFILSIGGWIDRTC